MTVDIKANNRQTADKKFLELIGRRNNTGWMSQLGLTTLERYGMNSFVPFDTTDDEKQVLIDAINEIKPHNGSHPLEDFTKAQLQTHLDKLQAAQEVIQKVEEDKAKLRKPKQTVVKKKRYKKKELRQ
jgi:hypothetical protein